MGALATVLSAAAAVELFSALLFALAYVRRPSERESGVAAILCVAATLRTTGSLLAADAGRTPAAVADERLAWLGLLAVLPMAVHFAFAVGGRRVRPVALGTAYVAAALLAGAAIRGLLPVPGLAAYLAAVAAFGTALVLFARAYLEGRRGALALVVGTTVLLATLAHDTAVAAGALSTGYLVDGGLAAFVAAMGTTLIARYADVAEELDVRTEQLRARTRELVRSAEELRLAQEELQKKEQLAVVGELAAVIAHEVRNPLAIIANAVAGLRKPVISREDHDTLLSILDEETSRLNRLVSDLLRYARPVSVQRQQISLADLLERTLALVQADGKSIKTDLQLECHDGRVWGDANLLRQVFENLVDNAIQAMGASGTLTVRVREATQDGADGIAVDIADTGEGMDTQVRSRARDPFFTTRPSGTGLGLAIVDRIVDAHGGVFAIESRSGEGTTVTVFLPHGSPSEPPVVRSRPPRGASSAPATP